MKRWLAILLFVTMSLPFMAQGNREKVEALKVSFITKKLDLTPAESEKFWPIYNEYNDKIKEIRRGVRSAYRKSGDTPGEAEDLYNLEYKSRQAEADVHKLYSEKIKAVIGVVKYVKLRRAEEEFKRQMLNAID